MQNDRREKFDSLFLDTKARRLINTITSRKEGMMATSTTPEFEDCLKFEDCQNCGKEIQYVMGSCRNCGAERPADYKPPNR
jgi:hypothetical protein